jgi:5-methylcytosine-specific restriction endonuclease McrA
MSDWWFDKLRSIRSAAATRYDRERYARAKATHTHEQWNTLLAICGDRCRRCGREGWLLTKDHIVPLRIGGSDGIENLQPLCGPCNSTKGLETVDYRPRDWHRRLGRETDQRT